MPIRAIFVALFRLCSLLVGLPSLLGTLYFGWSALRLYLLSPAASGAPARSSNTLIDLIESGARIFGAAFKLLGDLGQWLVILLFIVSAIALAFALLLWFTAQGLAQDRLWARVTASLCGLVLLLAITGFLAIRS